MMTMQKPGGERSKSGLAVSAQRIPAPSFRKAILAVVLAVIAPCAFGLTNDDRTKDALYTEALRNSSAHVVGERMVRARRDTAVSPGLKGNITQELANRCISLISRQNLEEFALFLEPLTPLEDRLFRKVSSMRLPIVSRTTLANLRGILAQKAILSPAEAARRKLVVEKTMTPDLEETLYGAYGCVFATVGPPDGTKRYGDVIIRFRESSRRTGWGTPWSGNHFVGSVLGWNPREIDAQIQNGTGAPIGTGERLMFTRRVTAGRDWKKSLAWQAVMYLRLAEGEKASLHREVAEKLIAETDQRRFWELFTLDPKDPVGYIEAKFSGFVPAKYFESIEIPPEHLAEVLSWPEAKPFAKIIRPVR